MVGEMQQRISITMGVRTPVPAPRLGMQVGMELVSAWMLGASQLENKIILQNISAPFRYVLSDLFSPR